MTTYITCADTAKLVRKALAAKFPSIKFSVRSKTYSGGASIDVSWRDGPTTKQVQAVTGPFEGASFDAMIDLKSSVYGTLNGKRVHFGADFIFCNRDFSVELMTRIAKQASKKWGFPMPTIEASKYDGSAVVHSDYWDSYGGRTGDQIVYQEAQAVAA